MKENCEVRQTYATRNAILKEMGYSSYTHYQSSALWHSIRSRAWVKHGQSCKLCHTKADVIHHIGYGRAVLEGSDLEPLAPLCNGCHLLVEFNKKGHKRHLTAAQGRYRQMLKRSMRGVAGEKLCHASECSNKRTKGSSYCRSCSKGTPPATVKYVQSERGKTKRSLAKEADKRVAEYVYTDAPFTVVTRELMSAGMSRNGAWSDKQLILLNADMDKPKGWLHTMIGREVPLEDAEEFLRLKDAHLDLNKPVKKATIRLLERARKCPDCGQSPRRKHIKCRPCEKRNAR